MKVAITGATGFLGRPLVTHLRAMGHRCVVLSRDPRRASARAPWPSEVEVRSMDDLPPVDALIHLAGESIVGLWTPAKRRRILASRVEGTGRLIAAMRWTPDRPKTVLVASAIGYYGHRPGETLDEGAGPDPVNGFRTQVCRAWENEARAAEALGCRVVPLRIGNVMDRQGGYLGGLLPFYRTCGGFVLGEPGAYLSWISLEDAVRMIGFALENEAIAGPLNVVSPYPVTQGTLAKTLALRVGRTLRGRIPERVLSLALGEFSRGLLDDQKVVPEKALAAGFRFAQPAWRSCLDALFA